MLSISSSNTNTNTNYTTTNDIFFYVMDNNIKYILQIKAPTVPNKHHHYFYLLLLILL